TGRSTAESEEQIQWQRLQENRHSTAAAGGRHHHSQGVRLPAFSWSGACEANEEAIMSCVYRKGVFKPLPADAEIITRKGEKLARWRDRKGKTRTAPLTDDGRRVRIETETWYAKYRDGNNHVVEVPTGCREEAAARQVLADLERKAERVRAGLITPAEARTAEHLTTPIGEHVEGYLTNLEARGATPKHVRETRQRLTRILDGCEFRALADLDASVAEAWLNRRRLEKASARTRNVDRA